MKLNWRHLKHDYHIDYASGVYGDVRRVKILYKKPDTALIQMQDPISAQQGIEKQDHSRNKNKTKERRNFSEH